MTLYDQVQSLKKQGKTIEQISIELNIPYFLAAALYNLEINVS